MKSSLRYALLFVLALGFSAVAQDVPKAPLGETHVTRSGKMYVQVYFEENFKGKSVRLEVPCELANDARLKEKGIPNDSIQSMKIPDGVVVTLFDNAGFGGKSKSFTGKAATLDEMKGLASSLKAEIKKP
jgi:hypothetical protein